MLPGRKRRTARSIFRAGIAAEGLSSLREVAVLCVTLLELDSCSADGSNRTRHSALELCAPFMARKFIMVMRALFPAGKPEMTATGFQGCAP